MRDGGASLIVESDTLVVTRTVTLAAPIRHG